MRTIGNNIEWLLNKIDAERKHIENFSAYFDEWNPFKNLVLPDGMSDSISFDIEYPCKYVTFQYYIKHGNLCIDIEGTVWTDKKHISIRDIKFPRVADEKTKYDRAFFISEIKCMLNIYRTDENRKSSSTFLQDLVNILKQANAHHYSLDPDTAKGFELLIKKQNTKSNIIKEAKSFGKRK